MVEVLTAGLVGYFLGAIPTGYIVCRLFRGVDIRQVGSGHTGGLNASRAAGIWAGVITGLVDTGLGICAVALTVLITDNHWAAATAGVMAIIGHNWSVYIKLKGGIGISTTVGSLIYLFPLKTIVVLAAVFGAWVMLIKLFHFHRIRSRILAMVFITPLFFFLRTSDYGLVLAALASFIMIIKTLPDWHRKFD